MSPSLTKEIQFFFDPVFRAACTNGNILPCTPITLQSIALSFHVPTAKGDWKAPVRCLCMQCQFQTGDSGQDLHVACRIKHSCCGLRQGTCMPTKKLCLHC